MDLDEIELKATRKLLGLDKKENKQQNYDDNDYLIAREECIEYKKVTETNVGDIEEAIKRCEQLTRPEHASWIGISNQLAILHVLEEYTRQKQINEEHQKINAELREKVKELDTKNDELLKDLYSANCIISDLTDSIPKQKIKDKIEELNKQEQELQNSISEEEREEYSDANISFQLCDIEIRREVLQELLQEEDK